MSATEALRCAQAVTPFFDEMANRGARYESLFAIVAHPSCAFASGGAWHQTLANGSRALIGTRMQAAELAARAAPRAGEVQHAVLAALDRHPGVALVVVLLGRDQFFALPTVAHHVTYVTWVDA